MRPPDCKEGRGSGRCRDSVADFCDPEACTQKRREGRGCKVFFRPSSHLHPSSTSQSLWRRLRKARGHAASLFSPLGFCGGRGWQRRKEGHARRGKEGRRVTHADVGTGKHNSCLEMKLRLRKKRNRNKAKHRNGICFVHDLEGTARKSAAALPASHATPPRAAAMLLRCLRNGSSRSGS